MNIARYALIFLLLFTGSTVLAQDEPSDATLLTTLDEVRFFDADVTGLRARIVSETPDTLREAEVVLRFGEVDGEPASRIEFLMPEELAGQLYISVPAGTYFFGPDLDSPIRVGATTEVFGDSAVAQTSGIRFADDYTVTAQRNVETDDGTEVLEVDLAANDFTVAFQVITVRVDPESKQPISAVLYAVSGLPFYEVFYEEYVTRNESDLYVRTQRIVNRLLLGRVTLSETLELYDEIQDPNLFDPTVLGAGNP